MSTEASKFFDHFATTFDGFYDGKRNKFMRTIDQKFRADMFIRFALTFQGMKDYSNSTILDVGCGSGVYIIEALKRGAKFVTGVDSARGMVELAKSKLSDFKEFNGRYSLILSDFLETEVEKHDYTIVMGVMDYIKEPVDFIKVIKQNTKVSAFLSFPSVHWLRTPIRKIRYNLRSCPVYFYDEEKIRRIAGQAGYDKIFIKKINGAGLDYHVRLDND